MDNRIYRHASAISLLLILLAFAGCNRNKETEDKMNMADSLMTSRPDSALAILSKIDTTLLSSRELRARYALLKSMALDKNYIDTTSFIILKPAINYYLKHGTPDEQLRTYYYQGRIYQNRGEDNDAMQSFMYGSDLKEKVTDSLLLAHTLVALGTIYFNHYNTIEFIHNNLEAAKLYEAIGKYKYAIKSYTNVLDGYVISNNKHAADSIISICIPLVERNSEGEEYLFTSLLTYTVGLCSPKEIKKFLNQYQNRRLTTDEAMTFAHGYAKIGEYEKARKLLSGIIPSESTMDSLKYTSIKIDVLERQGDYKQALSHYKKYSAKYEHYRNEQMSHDSTFANNKQIPEDKKLFGYKNEDRIIWVSLCWILGLIILSVWLYCKWHHNKNKRIIVENENQSLKNEQDNLLKEKERAELERDMKILEAENLEKDKKQLETIQHKYEQETANLRLAIAKLKEERDYMNVLQKEQTELAKPIQHIIADRISMLNSLLAKEITGNENYAKPYNNWIDTIHKDRKQFMDSTRLALAASHPKLMKYFEQHGLTNDEMNHLCLYAIGLRGKDVGEYTQTKRHYIISHEIRKKLGIDEHETNIGLYIRKLMVDFEI